MIHKIVAVGIVFLFIITSVTPMVIGYTSYDVSSENDELLENLAFMCYDEYGSNAKYEFYKEHLLNDYSNDEVEIAEVVEKAIPGELPLPFTTGPMNSPWPMYCHDTHHTGRSPYNTSHHPDGLEKWRIYCGNCVEGSAVIDDEGMIYFGSWGKFYAIYPNGTIKWQYPLNEWIESSPAIGEDGVIYVGVSQSWSGLYAFNPNGTLKWNYDTGKILSSPAIGEDGTIYFGTSDGGTPNEGSIYALNPNGTLKWRFRPDHLVYSSPAIGDDGTIYCGCHDEYLYALYSNGTLKWKFKTGHWIRVSPCIADDGTIYCVSLDGFLYALYPNGTLRWKTDMGEAGTSPSIGHDGTIYAGYYSLFAIEPNNGSIKWTFTPGGTSVIEGGTPCISNDGIIYFGTRIRELKGGEIIALNLDGTERWRKYIANDFIQFAPIIDSNGTVYIGSTWSKIKTDGYWIFPGYLHAFGSVESNSPPGAPTIDGEVNGRPRMEYCYVFRSVDPDNNPVAYYIDWDDGSTPTWSREYASNEAAVMFHEWSSRDTYTIGAKTRDVFGEESDWAYLEVSISFFHPDQFPFIRWLLERFPNMFPIIRNLLDM